MAKKFKEFLRNMGNPTPEFLIDLVKKHTTFDVVHLPRSEFPKFEKMMDTLEEFKRSNNATDPMWGYTISYSYGLASRVYIVGAVRRGLTVEVSAFELGHG